MHLLQVVAEFAVVLGIMVLVHEFGHFALAKLCGVRVEAFALGFGTRLFGVVYKGTDYRVNLLPLGGYVKMAGEMLGESAATTEARKPIDPGDFTAHPRWQRALIALAGPVLNFLLAVLLLAVVAHYHHEVDQYLNGPAVLDYVAADTPAAKAGLKAGDTLVRVNGVADPTWMQIGEESALHMNASIPVTYRRPDGQTATAPLLIDTGDRSGEFTPGSLSHVGLEPQSQPGPMVVQTVEPDTPASTAGLKSGDKLLSIDNYQPHSVEPLLAYLQDHNGAPAVLKVDRGGQVLTLPIVPRKLMLGTGPIGYKLGFSRVPPPADVVKLPLGQAMKQSLQENAEYSTLLLRVLKGMFTHQVAVKSVSGPVGMAQQIDLAVQYGKWTVLETMAAISLNLGILNLMPFPVLDGGMILFLLIEAIMRRDVNQVIKERVYQVAFVCIILFAALVMFNDIAKLHLKL